MLFRILDNLRTKPKEARQRVAFVTAVVVTLVVGGIWSLTLPARFASTSELATTEGTRPFAGFFNGLKQQFGTLRNQAQTIGSLISTTTATSTASTTDVIDLEMLLAATSSVPKPAPAAILIGTTSATTTTQ